MTSEFLTVLLKIHVFWDLTLCHWVSSLELGLFYPEDEGTMILCNVVNYSPNNTASYLTRLKASSFACSYLVTTDTSILALPDATVILN